MSTTATDPKTTFTQVAKQIGIETSQLYRLVRTNKLKGGDLTRAHQAVGGATDWTNLVNQAVFEI